MNEYKYHYLFTSFDLEHMRQVSRGSYLPVLNEFKGKEIHNIIIDTTSDGISILLKNVSWIYN